MAPRQSWCAFTAGGRPCSFGAGHRIEYHYVDGVRYGLGGVGILSAAEFARITRNGTR